MRRKVTKQRALRQGPESRLVRRMARARWAGVAAVKRKAGSGSGVAVDLAVQMPLAPDGAVTLRRLGARARAFARLVTSDPAPTAAVAAASSSRDRNGEAVCPHGPPLPRQRCEATGHRRSRTSAWCTPRFWGPSSGRFLPRELGGRGFLAVVGLSGCRRTGGLSQARVSGPACARVLSPVLCAAALVSKRRASQVRRLSLGPTSAWGHRVVWVRTLPSGNSRRTKCVLLVGAPDAPPRFCGAESSTGAAHRPPWDRVAKLCAGVAPHCAHRPERVRRSLFGTGAGVPR